MVSLWVHMVVKTILGGAHPYIEPKWPIMALQNHEHMTVREKSHYHLQSFCTWTFVALCGHRVINHFGRAHPYVEPTGPTMTL